MAFKVLFYKERMDLLDIVRIGSADEGSLNISWLVYGMREIPVCISLVDVKERRSEEGFSGIAQDHTFFACKQSQV